MVEPKISILDRIIKLFWSIRIKRIGAYLLSENKAQFEGIVLAVCGDLKVPANLLPVIKAVLDEAIDRLVKEWAKG